MNKKKTFSLLSLLMMAIAAIAQDSSTLISNQIIKQKTVDNFKQRPGKLLSLKMPCSEASPSATIPSICQADMRKTLCANTLYCI